MSAATASLYRPPSTATALPVPRSLEDTGLTLENVEQLLINTLYSGEATGLSVAERMRLPYTILEPIVERVRAEQLVEVRGSSGSGSATIGRPITR